MIQFTDGNMKKLQGFLFGMQDCTNQIEKSTTPENDRTLDCLHDRFEGYIQLALALSLVLTNVKGFFGRKSAD